MVYNQRMNGWIHPEKKRVGMRLDLGAGDPTTNEVQATGYVLQDVQPHEGIDLVCDIKELSTYVAPNSISELRMSHVLEHFTTDEAKSLLKTFYKLLQDDGKLIIIVPNFRWHAELVLNGHEKEAVYYCFGGQLDEYDIHKTGYTANILKNLLIEHKFALLTLTDETSISCVAVKV